MPESISISPCTAPLIGGLLILGGCSTGPQADYSQLGLVEVSGTVTLDGSPVAGAAVFMTDEQERYSFGVTDSSGHYLMMLNSEKSGVLPGPKSIQITTARNPLGEADESGDEGEESEEEELDTELSAASVERIPACYNSRSKMEINIVDSDAALDFELQSDCSTTSPT